MGDRKISIELKNVVKTYTIGDNKINAINDVSFKVYSGDFLTILGKSGSGKTTIVNQIGCLDRVTSGEIILDGKKTSKMSNNEIVRYRGKKIGYIFQKFNLIKNLTTLENVELPMIFQGVPKKERVERAKKLLENFEMGDRIYNKPTELSGGQQQRVAIARALANKPEIILADEPTGNLDSKTGKIVAQYLKELNNKGKTIILVTHDDALSKLGKKKIFLKDGQIVKSLK